MTTLLLLRSLNVFALGCALALAGCSRESGESAQPAQTKAAAKSLGGGDIDRSHRGSAMPDLAFTDATGKQLELKSLRGKPVLINLWATWCAPCVAELPALDAWAEERIDTLRVITVSQDMAQTEKVAGFMTRLKLNRLEPWLDPENQLSAHYRAESLPMTIYYDAEGREVWRFNGPSHWDEETSAWLAEAE